MGNDNLGVARARQLACFITLANLEISRAEGENLQETVPDQVRFCMPGCDDGGVVAYPLPLGGLTDYTERSNKSSRFQKNFILYINRKCAISCWNWIMKKTAMN